MWGRVGRLGNVAKDVIQGGREVPGPRRGCARRPLGKGAAGPRDGAWPRGRGVGRGKAGGEVRARGPGWASERLGQHRPRGGEIKRKKTGLL
jgi:hypothetical protein